MVIDVYDILQSKEDKATMPIYYEARLAKIDLKPEERPKIDPQFEEVVEDAEEATKERLAAEVGATESHGAKSSRGHFLSRPAGRRILTEIIWQTACS